MNLMRVYQSRYKSAPACRRQGKVDIKARVTAEVKPGILNSTFPFPEIC